MVTTMRSLIKRCLKSIIIFKQSEARSLANLANITTVNSMQNHTNVPLCNLMMHLQILQQRTLERTRQQKLATDMPFQICTQTLRHSMISGRRSFLGKLSTRLPVQFHYSWRNKLNKDANNSLLPITLVFGPIHKALPLAVTIFL